MTPDIQSILGPVFDPGFFESNRLIPDLPFSEYQALPGVNASLLKHATTYEMLSYAVGMAALDQHERALAELTGSDVSDVLARVEQCAPRTAPVRMVKAARQLIESDKLTAPQREAWSKICEGVDSREIKSATLVALDAKGLLEYETIERQESGVSDQAKETRAFALAVGDATHKAILEPHFFDADTWQDYWQLSPTKGLTTKAALEAAASDPRKLITPEIVDTARRCRDAVWKHKFAAHLLGAPGKSEATIHHWFQAVRADADNPEIGCWMKARIDRLPADPALGVVDIKTTRIGLHSESAMRREIFARQYHLQAALYLDAVEVVDKPREHFHIIWLTKEPPFICRVVEINQPEPEVNFITGRLMGRESYQEQRARFIEAWVSQYWECYENEESKPLTTKFD